MIVAVLFFKRKSHIIIWFIGAVIVTGTSISLLFSFAYITATFTSLAADYTMIYDFYFALFGVILSLISHILTLIGIFHLIRRKAVLWRIRAESTMISCTERDHVDFAFHVPESHIRFVLPEVPNSVN
ncbi:hypothetical protein ACOME3_000396 [Neoechinorhynchus agilis]